MNIKLTPVLDSTEQKQTSTYYKEKLNKRSHKVIRSTTVFFSPFHFPPSINHTPARGRATRHAPEGKKKVTHGLQDEKKITERK